MNFELYKKLAEQVELKAKNIFGRDKDHIETDGWRFYTSSSDYVSVRTASQLDVTISINSIQIDIPAGAKSNIVDIEAVLREALNVLEGNPTEDFNPYIEPGETIIREVEKVVPDRLQEARISELERQLQLRDIALATEKGRVAALEEVADRQFESVLSRKSFN